MPDWRRAGLTDTRESPHAALAGLPLREVTLGDGFWRPWAERNRTIGLPRLLELLREHGAIDNLKRLAGLDVPRRGLRWTDSDLAKWLEGASYVLQTTDDPELRAGVDESVAAFAGAQGADGYLNSYFVDERFDERWTKLESDHELYCAGHFFQGAVAHHRIAGDRTLLDVATRYADYIAGVFGPGKREEADGHPEVELALIELARATGNRVYADLAGFFLSVQGLAEMQGIEGHAVRALYFNAGGSDWVAESGDAAARAALERLWADLTGRKMYVTGGVGGRYGGESIGRAYELPSERAYAETCAALANVFLNWRMLQVDPAAKYADLMELALYNGSLAGLSLDGRSYFYVNPLATSGLGEGDPWYAWARRGPHQRIEWYDCTCCPTNMVRLLASVQGYITGLASDGLYLHLYDAGRIDTTLRDGRPLALDIDTRYPWDGHIALTVRRAPGRCALYLRVPGWCAGATLSVGGVAVDAPCAPGSYARIERDWRVGDVVELDLPMPVTPLYSSARLRECWGQVALRRGPLVYCLEAADHPGVDVGEIWLDPAATFAAEHRPDLLGGVTTIVGDACRQVGDDPLYAAAPADARLRFGTIRATLVPYYAWANRGPGAMTVWAPYRTR